MEYNWQGKTKAIIDIPVPVPFHPPWIVRYLTCDQILNSSVKNQWQPKPWHSVCACVHVCTCTCTCRHAHNLTITESPNTFSISFYLHAWKLPSTLPPFVRNSSLYIIFPFLTYLIYPKFWLHIYLFIVYVMISSVVHTIQDQWYWIILERIMKEAAVIQFPVSAWRASGKEHKTYTATLWAETVGQDLQNMKQFCPMTKDVHSSILQDDHLHSYLLPVLT